MDSLWQRLQAMRSLRQRELGAAVTSGLARGQLYLAATLALKLLPFGSGLPS